MFMWRGCIMSRMEIDLDKTQDWLNRTQSISRGPAVRGGVDPDLRARRQTASGIALVVAAVLLLLFLPTVERLINQAATQAAQSEAKPQGGLLNSARSTAVESAFSPVPSVSPGRQAYARKLPMTEYRGPYFTAMGVATDHVPPPAPVWLVTMPREWNQMPVPAGSAKTSVLYAAGRAAAANTAAYPSDTVGD